MSNSSDQSVNQSINQFIILIVEIPSEGKIKSWAQNGDQEVMHGSG